MDDDKAIKPSGAAVNELKSAYWNEAVSNEYTVRLHGLYVIIMYEIIIFMKNTPLGGGGA